MKKSHKPDDTADHNRIVIAVLLSLLILVGWQFFYMRPHAQQEMQRKQQQQQQQTAVAKPENILRPREVVLADTKRLPVQGKKVTGSISLKGLRLDDLRLNGQYVTIEKKELVPLFNPSGAPWTFYAESGWLSDNKTLSLPTQDTLWTLAPGSVSAVVSGGPPVTLKWDNNQGLSFERSISLDDAYLFTVTQKITNKTGAALSFNAYHTVARRGFPSDYRGLYTLHEGPVARFNGKLEELQYKKLASGSKTDVENVQGWAGITDKYWMAVVLPDPQQKFNARILGSTEDKIPHFQSDIVDAAVTVSAGETTLNTTHIYAGVKILDTMKAYNKLYGFDRIEDAIDFGIWYFIVKIFYALFHMILSFEGSVALSIVTFTVIVRGAMFPLASKAYTSMARMKKIQPELKELQTKYKGDKTELQAKIFELYQRENVNPFSGCWPMLVQIPVFFALYKVILISVDLRQAPFWGWIHDLSEPDPTSVLNLFGLIPWTPPPAFTIGAWPVLFCLTMVLQKRLSAPMPDPVQEKIQSWFPVFITFMMAHFPSGLVIYWTWSNTLAILQQYYITNKVGDEKVSLIRGHHARHKPKKKKSKA
jgi:YidC/Oxa1 family membrane protein insertase